MTQLPARSWSLSLVAIAVGIAVIGSWYASKSSDRADATIVDQQPAIEHPASDPEIAANVSEDAATPNRDSGEAGSDIGDIGDAAGLAETDPGYFNAILLPAEFAGLADRDGSVAQFHKKLEREPEDTEWATGFERALADFIEATIDPNEFAVRLIECRSMSCEILANGYGDRALDNWMALAKSLFESGMFEEWMEGRGDGPGRGGCGGSEPEPGIHVLNCQFTIAGESGGEPSLSLDAPYADGAYVERLPVPDGFASLIEGNARLYELHRTLETEAVDFAWAQFIEDQVREYLSLIPELASAEIIRIECRTTICELQMTVDVTLSPAAWSRALTAFEDLPWDDISFSAHGDEIENGLLGVIWMLQRQTDD